MKKLLLAIVLLTLIGCSKEDECQCFQLRFQRQHSTGINDINGKFDYKLVSTCSVGETTYTFDDFNGNGIIYCFEEPISY